jgi:hypothetical protein
MDGVTMGTSSEIETRTLEHAALLHGDMDAFLSYLIPFVRAGTEIGNRPSWRWEPTTSRPSGMPSERGRRA